MYDGTKINAVPELQCFRRVPGNPQTDWKIVGSLSKGCT